MIIPKCDKNSECTFKISTIVLSQFSCNAFLACNAISTFANNSIMWSAMEKFLSWMSVFSCAMCFYNSSIFGRILPWIFASVALIVAYSFNNFSCMFVRYLIVIDNYSLEFGILVWLLDGEVFGQCPKFTMPYAMYNIGCSFTICGLVVFST